MTDLSFLSVTKIGEGGEVLQARYTGMSPEAHRLREEINFGQTPLSVVWTPVDHSARFHLTAEYRLTSWCLSLQNSFSPDRVRSWKDHTIKVGDIVGTISQLSRARFILHPSPSTACRRRLRFVRPRPRDCIRMLEIPLSLTL